MLEMQVQMLASQGVTNRKEITDAYRYLGVDPGHLHLISDDHILGAFRSRLQDISPAAVEETRNALRIIGRSRNSERIKQEASNAIETYDQALSWLGIDEGQPDDFVVTMFTIKVRILPAARFQRSLELDACNSLRSSTQRNSPGLILNRLGTTPQTSTLPEEL